MPSDPALKQKKFMPLWPCPETKVHALWPCPETKKFMPSDPALKQKFMHLWPCPSFYIIDIISSFLTIIIPLKAGCKGGSLNP
jgi:hypothetical protein